jgi:hypothetical protein
MHPICRLTMSALCSSVMLAALSAGAAELVWQKKLEDKIEWSKLTDVGVLITASDDGLTVFGPKGKQLWSLDDLDDLAPFNVSPIDGSPYVLINEHVSKIPQRARLRILELDSGKSIFDTGAVRGNNLGAFPVPEQAMVVFAIDQPGGGGRKSGTYLVAFDVLEAKEL